LFETGEYLPLEATGACAKHVCAFARRLGEQATVVVAPLWAAKLKDWANTGLSLPDPPSAQASGWVDVLTGLTPASSRLADLLAHFPVAMLAPAAA
jgi:(1->4)-alpha-D-glucan 1-alpha-D-glucosylmutase